MNWAETAEAALVQVDEHRMQAKRHEVVREMQTAVQHRTLADDFETYRERAVGMATMWARVAGALQVTEPAGRS
ncbi:hypothetical protein [Streptomyces chartreusis]|uniref:hypothetical protein n=1 Tax=Streptomyces chartreusis TaxID=1969 RepID=UPI0036762610